MPDVAYQAALLMAALALDCAMPRPVEPDNSARLVAEPIPQQGVAAEVPASPSAVAPRIVYPADHAAFLSLPDGKRRAVRSLLNVQRRMRFGDYVWNDDHVPPGEAWVRIDLDRQTISVFRGPNEIGTAVILYGTDGKPTPTGSFPILEKATHHRSTLYDAEMPYMLRLTGDGVAIHASNVRERAATHGCIGVPPEFAKLLFGQVRRGDRVAILRRPGRA